jgi:COP9 signalosome complex subunit 1
LIETGQLSARIDLEARVLVAKERDLRSELYEEATESIENFIREARMKLLRTNVIRAGLEVAPPTKNKGGWGNDMSSDGVTESWAAPASSSGRQMRSGKSKW